MLKRQFCPLFRASAIQPVFLLLPDDLHMARSFHFFQSNQHMTIVSSDIVCYNLNANMGMENSWSGELHDKIAAQWQMGQRLADGSRYFSGFA